MSCYIIAEIGPNHMGKIDIALSLVKQLAEIGVDAVKFQLNFPENFFSKDSFKPRYQKESDSGNSPMEMSKQYQLSHDEHIKLFKACQDYGVDYLCTGFEINSLKFLNESLDMKYFKVPSGEILTIDLLEYIAKCQKPIFLSTGMASYDDIQKSLDILNQHHTQDITILHCVSNYPAPAEDVNLNVMLELKRRFHVEIGFSDHTLGNNGAIAAVALGAKVIEKHVTFNKNAVGPDHQASSTVEEFASLVQSIREVEKMMGTTEKIFSKDELEIKKAARKSIVSTKKLKIGHIISREDICFKRPGFGFRPVDMDFVIGKTVVREIEENRVILKDFINE
jgi:N,N'-diacetyllegionaminate synthase